MAVGSASLICLPFSAAMALGLESESGSDSEYLISATNDFFDQHSSVFAKGFYEIHTTYQCLSLSFHIPSFLLARTGCPFLVLCFAG